MDPEQIFAEVFIKKSQNLQEMLPPSTPGIVMILACSNLQQHKSISLLDRVEDWNVILHRAQGTHFLKTY